MCDTCVAFSYEDLSLLHTYLALELRAFYLRETLEVGTTTTLPY
jgi:hypothetical protein